MCCSFRIYLIVNQKKKWKVTKSRLSSDGVAKEKKKAEGKSATLRTLH